MSDVQQSALDARVQQVVAAYRNAGGSVADLKSGAVLDVDAPQTAAEVNARTGTLTLPSSVEFTLQGLYSRPSYVDRNWTLARQQLSRLAEGLARNGSVSPNAWGPGDHALTNGAAGAAAEEILDDFIDELGFDPEVARQLRNARTPKPAADVAAVRGWATEAFSDPDQRRAALQAVANNGGAPVAYADAMLAAQHTPATATDPQAINSRSHGITVTDASYANLRSDLAQQMVTEFQELPAAHFGRSPDKTGRRAARAAGELLKVHREHGTALVEENSDLVAAYREAAEACRSYAADPQAKGASVALGNAFGKLGNLEATTAGHRMSHYDSDLTYSLHELDNLDRADSRLQSHLTSTHGSEAKPPALRFRDIEHEKVANAESRRALREGHAAQHAEASELAKSGHVHMDRAARFREYGGHGPTAATATGYAKQLDSLAEKAAAAGVATHLSQREYGRWTGPQAAAPAIVEPTVTADRSADQGAIRFLDGSAPASEAATVPADGPEATRADRDRTRDVALDR